jgi:hypothetical protein
MTGVFTAAIATASMRIDPNQALEPNEKARRLAEMISEAMNVTAFVLIFILAGLLVGVPWFLVSRKRGGDDAQQ